MNRKRLRSWLLLGGLAGLLPACEKNPKASPDAAPTASAVAPAPIPSEEAKPSVPPKPRRKLEDCKRKGAFSFENPETEAAVRVKLQKPSGEVSVAELKKLRSLDLSQAKSNDALDPCLFSEATELRGLYLAPGKLDDLTPLGGLTKLESLRVSITNVKDLTPLAGLKKLDRLDLGRTPVSDLSPLAGLTGLTELLLDDTEVSDVTPLAALKNLEVLSLKNTRVKDVSPLRGLTKLKHVYLAGAPVDDVSPLLTTPGLKVHKN